MLYWDDMQGFRSFFSWKVWFWGRVFIYYLYDNLYIGNRFCISIFYDTNTGAETENV